VFNICDFGVNKISEKMENLASALETRINPFLMNMKDMHKATIKDLETRVKSGLREKIKEWHSLDNQARKIVQTADRQNQLEYNMTLQKAGEIEKDKINVLEEAKGIREF
jgi:hypothetical protein